MGGFRARYIAGDMIGGGGGGISFLVETDLLLIQSHHLLNVLLGSLLEVALSHSNVELVAALTPEFVDHSSSFALKVAAV